MNLYTLERVFYNVTILPTVMKIKKFKYESKIKNWNNALNFIYYHRNFDNNFSNKEDTETLRLLESIFKQKINNPNDIRRIVQEMRLQDNDPSDPLDDVSGYRMILDLMPVLIERANELGISASDFDDLEDCLLAYEYAPFVFDLDRGYVKDSLYYSRVKKVAIELTKERLQAATNVKELHEVLKLSSHILIRGYSKIIYRNSDKSKRKLELLRFEKNKLKECKIFLENNPDVAKIFNDKIKRLSKNPFKKR